MQVVAENGTVVYGCRSDLWTRYRSFSRGDECEVRLVFMPRLAGGSYRVQFTVATNNGRGILAYDPSAFVFFVEPLVGIVGADLDGQILVDGFLVGPGQINLSSAAVRSDLEPGSQP